jgi:hypothetical protein
MRLGKAFLLRNQGPPVERIEFALMSGGCDDRFQDFNAVPQLPVLYLESVELALILFISRVQLVNRVPEDAVRLH